MSVTMATLKALKVARDALGHEPVVADVTDAYTHEVDNHAIRRK